MIRGRFIAAVALALLTAVGCGGSSAPDTPAESRLTRDQASTLSRVLYRNVQDVGAEYRASVPGLGARGVVVEGYVNFKAGTGWGLVQAVQSDDSLSQGRRIFWTRTTIVEGDIPGLRAAMEERGRSGVTWVSRRVTNSRGSIDPVLRFLNALSAARPENPILLQQGEQRYLGSESLDGTSVEVFRSGQLTLYVDGEGQLLRVDAPISGLRGVSSVRLTNRRSRPVDLPKRSAQVDLADIQGLYRDLIEAAQAQG